MPYPHKLKEIIQFFESFSDEEKRENLIAYADSVKKHEPTTGEIFNLEDIRHDQECTDTVGIFLRVDAENCVFFKVTLGPHVQTLTRAMTTILCQGLNGSKIDQILNVSQDFISRIVGNELVRIRSQTVYYVLGRMKTACRVYLAQKITESQTTT